MIKRGEPFPESIEKAKRLQSVQPNGKAYVIYRVGGVETNPVGGYLTLGDSNQVFTIPDNLVGEVSLYMLAAWIDMLPTRVSFLFSLHDGRDFYVDGASYHADLWQAEIASLTRDRALIYNCANGLRFRP